MLIQLGNSRPDGDLAPVVQKVDLIYNNIHRLNHYPVDSAVCFVKTYQLDSDLSVFHPLKN